MRTLNYKNAEDNAQKAAINAAYRNAEMRCTYTAAQQSTAQRTIDMLDTAFSAQFFINYRKKFIAIKADNAVARSKKLAKDVLSLLENNGYEVVKTKQGIVVRIMR